MAKALTIEQEGHKSGGTPVTASSMRSSVLRFNDVNFVVGNNTKSILSDVTGAVKFGSVLAIMGPSGAGKTTLISALSLDAHYGQAYGEVTLNGVPLTDEIFKSHCYVVKQHDKHWPYLTCRETLMYAAELFQVGETRAETTSLVDEVIQKMGLETCSDTRNARLSGGQQRRLSIGVALLKKPTVLFLDEPTSSLDSASAEAIMKEIVRVAKAENIIIVCTIHQPSTKVYNGFDKLMLMSRGREAFSGDVKDAIPYFNSIGHSCPPATNPAEYFLDLVNSDFTEEAAVDQILAEWQETRNGLNSSHHSRASLAELTGGTEGVSKIKARSLFSETMIMLRRHFALITRDPVLYIGRCIVFLMACTFFGFVYWNGREFEQDQAINKMWLNVWYVGVPSNMGVVAVYALNDEFKSILRETKNGMTTGISYVLAKTILVIPIFFLFALFALGIPAFLIQDYPVDVFGWSVLLFASLLFVFESVAEALSVWFEDPIIGMLNFMQFWFGAFLFGGFLIPLRDMYWPFKLFYYVMPYSYYVRSSMYELFSRSTFEPCIESSVSAVCVNSTAGLDVLQELEKVFPVVSSDDNTTRDLFILLAIGGFYKLLYVAGILYKTSQVATVKNSSPPVIAASSTNSSKHSTAAASRHAKVVESTSDLEHGKFTLSDVEVQA